VKVASPSISGRFSLLAGPSVRAPHLPFVIPAGTGSIGWFSVIRSHRGERRSGANWVVSGLLNSKKLLRCTFGDNLERRPKCWIGVLRVGGIVHLRQHCASVPPYGLASRLRAGWMQARVTKVARVSARFSKSLASVGCDSQLRGRWMNCCPGASSPHHPGSFMAFLRGQNRGQNPFI
jgi:hypothetical protein